MWLPASINGNHMLCLNSMPAGNRLITSFHRETVDFFFSLGVYGKEPLKCLQLPIHANPDLFETFYFCATAKKKTDAQLIYASAAIILK